VSLTINVGDVGTSRAINKELATTGSYVMNHYEVAFLNGSNIYRTDWTSPGTGHITVPVGDYTGAGKAVAFAGYKNGGGTEYTLYAVGKITKINLVDQSTIYLDKSTSSVTFGLVPINSGVTNTLTSTFHILGPGNHSTSITAGNISTWYNALGTTSYPMFVLPSSKPIATDGPLNNVGGDSSLANPTGSLNVSNNIVGRWNFSNTNYLGVSLKGGGGWTVTPTYPTIISEISESPIQIIVTEKYPPKASTSIMPSDGNFYFSVSVGDTLGYNKVYISVPVVPIKDGVDGKGNSPLPWTIRGGVENSVLDEGENSDGGAALLFFTDDNAEFDIYG